MNPSDFTANSPGRLVPIPEDGYAFVPNPLPEEIDLDPETVAILTEASRAVGVLHPGTALRQREAERQYQPRDAGGG